MNKDHIYTQQHRNVFMNIPSTGLINQPNLGCNIGIAQSGSGRQINRSCRSSFNFSYTFTTTALKMPRHL